MIESQFKGVSKGGLLSNKSTVAEQKKNHYKIWFGGEKNKIEEKKIWFCV